MNVDNAHGLSALASGAKIVQRERILSKNYCAIAEFDATMCVRIHV